MLNDALKKSNPPDSGISTTQGVARCSRESIITIWKAGFRPVAHDRDSVRDFVDREFLPIVRDHYRARRVPPAYHPDARGDGAPRLQPEGIWAARHRSVSYGLVMQEAGAGRLWAAAQLASVQGALVMCPIHTFGSRRRRRWLPPLGAGKAIGCFGLTGPTAVRTGGMKTKAVKERGSLRSFRREDVDYERLRRRRGGGVGHARRRGARVPGRGMKGFSAPGSLSSPCGLPSRRAHLRRRPGAGGKHPPQRAGAERPPRVPDRRGTGSRGARSGPAMAVLRRSALLHEGAEDVRPAGRLLPANTQAKFADMLTEITSARAIALAGNLKEAGKMRPQQV